MTNMLKQCLIAAGVLFFGVAVWADPSECDQVQGNLIVNCGWESNCWYWWNPTGSIDIGRDEFAHSGDYRGVLYPHLGMEWFGQHQVPVEVGQTYTLSFWVRNPEPLDRIQVIWRADFVDEIVFDQQNIPAAQDYTQFVIPDLVASNENMEVWLGFANALGQIDIDDVVLAPSKN